MNKEFMLPEPPEQSNPDVELWEAVRASSRDALAERWANHSLGNPVPDSLRNTALSAVRMGLLARRLNAASQELSNEKLTSIGGRLHRVREHAGVAVAELANGLAVPPAYIRELEADDRAIPRFRPAILATILDVLDVGLREAANSIRSALEGWDFAAGTRSAATGAPSERTDAFLRIVGEHLRDRGRSDLA